MSKSKEIGRGIDALLNRTREPLEDSFREVKEKQKKEKDSYVRTCVFLKEDVCERFKSLAYFERRSQKDLVSEVLENYLKKVDSKHLEEAIKAYSVKK